MIQAIFSSTSYEAIQKKLDAAVLRHEALSSNLANIQTPGYKRVDIQQEFKTELTQAIQAKDAHHIRQLEPRIAADTNTPAKSANGNNVSMDYELMELSRNSLEHETMTQFISGSLRHLRMAITGRAQP